MHLDQITEKTVLPDGVTATMNGFVITMKGPKGELSRKVGSKRYDVKVENNTVVFSAKNVTRREKRLMMVNTTHIKNMAKGVTEGHVYRLKICSGHFPMNVSLKGDVLEVKNFIGEAVPRKLALKENCTVKIDGHEITVESTSKEVAGNQAAAIELLTRRPGFDNRIFQDGIYITEKDGKVLH